MLKKGKEEDQEINTRIICLQGVIEKKMADLILDSDKDNWYYYKLNNDTTERWSYVSSFYSMGRIRSSWCKEAWVTRFFIWICKSQNIIWYGIDDGLNLFIVDTLTWILNHDEISIAWRTIVFIINFPNVMNWAILLQDERFIITSLNNCRTCFNHTLKCFPVKFDWFNRQRSHQLIVRHDRKWLALVSRIRP